MEDNSINQSDVGLATKDGKATSYQGDQPDSAEAGSKRFFDNDHNTTSGGIRAKGATCAMPNQFASDSVQIASMAMRLLYGNNSTLEAEFGELRPPNNLSLATTCNTAKERSRTPSGNRKQKTRVGSFGD